jgi:CRP-like cAMP-binding protein
LLSADDFALLAPHLRPMKLALATVLFESGAPIERIYFPHHGAISLVVPLESGAAIEAGMIGADGVVGASAALGNATALNRAVVQVDGDGSTISVPDMQTAVAASGSLRTALYRFDQSLLAQAQQSVACNAKHGVEERFCRWLLRTRDIVHSDRLQLTQEFLAEMLGVRRTSVTLVAHHLKAINLINYRRGHIELLDLAGLHEATCECYRAVKLHEAALRPPPASANHEIVIPGSVAKEQTRNRPFLTKSPTGETSSQGE